MKTIPVYCKNTGTWVDVEKGSTLEDVYKQIGLEMPYGPTNCLVNNRSEGLHYTLNDSRDIEFQNITTDSGLRTYTRSLFFVLYKAVHDHYPGARLRIGMPVSNGYYCALDIQGGVTDEIVMSLRAYMQDIIQQNLRFHRVTCHTTDAIELFRQQGLMQKVKLLESIGDLYTHYYTLGDPVGPTERRDVVPNGRPSEEGGPSASPTGGPRGVADGEVIDFFYGSLLLRTGQIHVFDLVPFGEGLLLRIPDQKHPNLLKPMKQQGKMFEIFQEERRWQDIMGISTVGELNRALLSGQISDIVNVSEALQEKKIARIADHIAEHPDIKVVLIAGPSSSGKTTFAKRLCIHLKGCGKRPVQISIDNYAVDRELSPRDEKGDYDFEHIDAINLDLFNMQMTQLLDGEEVELPFFDFTTGKSLMSGQHLRLEPETIIVLEGNHALNPRMSEKIADEAKFKIYASALTTIMLDDHNYIPTTDNRLLRRICRDYKYRGYAPQETIRRCASVSAGEEKWIFPFQEQADVMINTSLLYEFAALRAQALPLLEQVPEKAAEYTTATRLRKFLSYFVPMPLDAVPPTSLLREFMGHSAFKY